MASSHDERTVELHEILCAHCQVSNPSDRKFCRSCGQPLWEPCVDCGTKNATDVGYCGKCGANLTDGHDVLLRRNETLLQSAETMANEGRYYEALSALRRVANKGDSRLEHFVEKARVRYGEIQEIRNQKAEEAEGALEQAQREFASREFEAAKQILDGISVGLQTPEMKELVREVDSKLSQINSLTDHIKKAIKAKKLDGLLPYVNQLMGLTKDDPAINRLHEQLTQRQDKLNVSHAQRQLTLAKEHVTRGRYLEAADQLTGVDRDSIPEKWQGTYDTVVELGWLLRQLRSCPFIAVQLPTFASRLQKLNPQDPGLAKLVEQVAQRMQRSNGDARFATPWTKLPEAASIGYPVRHWQSFGKIEGVDEFEELQKEPVRFLIAYGLALQGLGLAHLSPNLIGRKSGLMDRFTSRRSSSSVNTVWGIDLGTTGIRAIEISRTKPKEAPRVTNVVSVRHSASLNDVSATENAVEIAKNSIKELIEQASITRGKAVVSFPGPKSLGRYFEIPRLSGNKLVDAVTYEARMQIPIPVEAIEFDWHTWDQDDSARFVGITLLAARKDQIEETLQAFEGGAIKPIAIQSCCLALYNAAYHEFWRGREDEAEPLAMLDVGTESSTLIVGSPSQIRYRSIAIGTEKMNRYLMTRFNMTRDKAEIAREEWSGYRWMHQLDHELVPLYRELASEVRRTLTAYQNEGIRVSELLVTGGGARQYGLLRDFIHGDAQQNQTNVAE